MDTMDQKPGYTSGFPVDMAIEKATTSAITHVLGARLMQGKSLFTSDSSAEGDASAFTFDFMDGWRDGNGDFFYQSWMWRRAPGFFDVVAYEGDGQGGRRIPHSLGAEPEMMWIKNRATNTNWAVYSKTHPTGVLNLDATYPVNLSTQSWDNDTPTSEVFPVAPLDNWLTNDSGKGYIAYLFASVPGISDIGSYTASGTDLDIDCGFTNGARFVLIKRTDDAGAWWVFDTLRGITSSSSPRLNLNDTSAQSVGNYIEPFSKGFTVTTNIMPIGTGEYIYMAIA
jgi:hypothetical protein